MVHYTKIARIQQGGQARQQDGPAIDIGQVSCCRYGFGSDGSSGSGLGTRCEVDRIIKLAREGIPDRQYICSESEASPYAGAS